MSTKFVSSGGLLVGPCAVMTFGLITGASPAFGLTSAAVADEVYLRPVLQCQTVDPSSTPADGASSESGAPTTGSVVLDMHGFPAQQSDPTTQQFLPLLGSEAVYCLVGPAEGTGDVFDGDAKAIMLSQGWGVTVNLRSGPEGEGVFNAVAAACNQRAASCPTGQLAIELNGIIQSAPSMNAPTYTGGVEISGDFTEDEARNLARVINGVPLLEQVDTEPDQSPPTAPGKDSFSSAWIFGLSGLLGILAIGGWYVGWSRRGAALMAGTTAGELSLSPGSDTTVTQTTTDEFVVGTNEEG